MLMTLEDIKNCDKELLTPDEVAPFLGFNAQSIRDQAKDRPELLGFPTISCGTRTKIPRRPFLRFLEYGNFVVLDPALQCKYDYIEYQEVAK